MENEMKNGDREMELLHAIVMMDFDYRDNGFFQSINIEHMGISYYTEHDPIRLADHVFGDQKEPWVKIIDSCIDNSVEGIRIRRNDLKILDISVDGENGFIDIASGYLCKIVSDHNAEQASKRDMYDPRDCMFSYDKGARDRGVMRSVQILMEKIDKEILEGLAVDVSAEKKVQSPDPVADLPLFSPYDGLSIQISANKRFGEHDKQVIVSGIRPGVLSTFEFSSSYASSDEIIQKALWELGHQEHHRLRSALSKLVDQMWFLDIEWLEISAGHMVSIKNQFGFFRFKD